MAADIQTDIAIRLTADTKGGKAAEQSLDRIKRKSEETSKTVVGGFVRMFNAAERFHSICNKIIGIGFFLNGLESAVNLYNKLTESARKAKEEAEKLRKEMSDKSAAEEIRKVSESYNDLKNAISSVADARSRDNELFSEEVKIRREAEDAASAAAEADELAAVDPNGEDADRQRENIRSRYAADRARKAADRKRTDVVIRRQGYQQQAEDANAAADQLEASLSGDDKAIVRARTRASTYAKFATMNNEKDGTWYNRSKRTEEGDAERERMKTESEKAKEEVKRLEAEKKEKEKEIADLRAKAAHANRMSGVLYQAIGTAETERETVTVNEDTANAATAAKEAAEQKKIADAEAAKVLLSRQKAELQAKIATEQSKKDAAGKAVYEAQGNYDLAAASGSRGARALPAAQAALTEAQNAAQNVNHAADTAINALTETLKSVEARLKAAQSFLESQSKQQRNAWSESPAGA